MTKRSAEIEAYNRIKKALIMKRLHPGQQLTEEWMGKNLNMSRTPIRSALKSLEREGLIKTIPNRGAFVANPSEKEIIDTYNVRILLECYAIEQAIPIIRDEDILKMKNLLMKEKEAYEKRDFEMFIEVNDEIHKMPAIISGNQCLLDHVLSLIAFGNCFLILRDSFYTKPIDKVKSIPEHEQIVKALERRDKFGATESLRKHLESSVDTFVANRRNSIF